ncbi:hypothetical protein BH09MYX1_BH09MYX1_64570 [soil metagenome]
MTTRAHVLAAVIVAVLAAAAPALADDAPSPPPSGGIVYVDDGSTLSGDIVEEIAGDHVSVRVAATLVVVPWARIVRIDRLAWTSASSDAPSDSTSDDAPKRFEPHVAIWTSPISAVFLGGVLELEARVAPAVSIYATGELYGVWKGIGLQTGLRYFFRGIALDGFFVDVHARAAYLYVNQIVGGGLGADIGRGGWSLDCDHSHMWTLVSSDRHFDGFTATPKLRLMLGYTF